MAPRYIVARSTRCREVALNMRRGSVKCTQTIRATQLDMQAQAALSFLFLLICTFAVASGARAVPFLFKVSFSFSDFSIFALFKFNVVSFITSAIFSCCSGKNSLVRKVFKSSNIWSICFNIIGRVSCIHEAYLG